MIRYIIKRLLYALITVIGVATIVFILQRLTGNPVTLLLPQDMWSEENFKLVSEQLGLDKPLAVQYFRFISDVFRGNMGHSYRQSMPVMQLVLSRVPATLQLGLVGMIIAMIIGIPAGIIAALKRNTPVDKSVIAFAMLGQSMPGFWLGIMMMLVFAVNLRWLPAVSDGSLKSLIMPALTLGLTTAAKFARMTRSSVLEVISMDYVRTAKGKGLSRYKVVMKHIFRNALIPIVTMAGVTLGHIMGGTIMIETVFGWPGIGRLSVEALNGRDFPVVQTIVLLISITCVLINLGVDLLYGYLDPRIKIEAKG
jgi:peptide/nickel transport system permease protein